jgi:hypothetical protein
VRIRAAIGYEYHKILKSTKKLVIDEVTFQMELDGHEKPV